MSSIRGARLLYYWSQKLQKESNAFVKQPPVLHTRECQIGPYGWTNLMLMCTPPPWPRKSAFQYIGGLDETLSEPGECGIFGDWELSTRMWLAGFQVLYTRALMACMSQTLISWSWSLIYLPIPLSVLSPHQVMHMPGVRMHGDNSGKKSGTHKPETAERCWGRQVRE